MRLIDADALNKKIAQEMANSVLNGVSQLYREGLMSAKLMLDTTETVAKDNNVPTNGWISVKDRLPEFGEPYYAACRSLTDDREPWVIEGNYGLVTHDKPWGVPLIAWGEAEVYAWMPRVCPEPPKEAK